MTKRLEILETSLKKKQELFDQKLENHFTDVKSANGQPLNDKRNGQATRNRWEKQNNALRTLKASIEKTQNAITKEKEKIQQVEATNENLPQEIIDLIKNKELVQWRKHPHIFFVPGVDKARITWDKKKKIVAHSFVNTITIQDQRSKFVKIYNSLHAIFNAKNLKQA